MKTTMPLLFLILLFSHCSMNQQESKFSGSLKNEYAPDITAYEEIQLEEDQMQAPRTMEAPEKARKNEKIIRSGNLKIETNNLMDTKEAIDEIVEKYRGYYENETLRNIDENQKYKLKIRVASTQFSAMLIDIENIDGLILEKNVDARDVGEEYLDLSIRLENNQAYLKRYQQLLSKAGNVKEIIEIQEKIREIELQIDRNKGRIAFLDDQVRYSTLNIELNTAPKEILAILPPTYGEEAKMSFYNGLRGVRFFTLFVFNFWPLFLLVAFIIALLKVLRLSQKNKQSFQKT